MNEKLVGQPGLELHARRSRLTGLPLKNTYLPICLPRASLLMSRIQQMSHLSAGKPGRQKSLLIIPSLIISGVIVHTTWLQA